LRKTDPAAKSLSAQAFALAPKIKEVDNWLRDDPGAQEWLFECHPELSFRAIADGRVLAGKKTPHGQIDRLRLIQQKFSDAVDVIAETRLTAKKAELADILDAYAAAHSALRVAVCNNEKLGGETDNAGIIMRMVF
jgi:predicted RNase H-like nuclease